MTTKGDSTIFVQYFYLTSIVYISLQLQVNYAYDNVCMILFLMENNQTHCFSRMQSFYIKKKNEITNFSSNCATIDKIYSFCMLTVYDFLTSNVQELLTKLFYQIINKCSVKDDYLFNGNVSKCLLALPPLSGSLHFYVVQIRILFLVLDHIILQCTKYQCLLANHC